MRGSVLIVLAPLLFGITACPQRRAVWVLPESTSNRLEFGLGVETGQERSVEFGGLTVTRCGDSAAETPPVWAVEAIDVMPDSQWPVRVRYGVVPDGFRERVPAESLGPDCYVAATSGTGIVKFRIEPSGRVRSLEPMRESSDSVLEPSDDPQSGWVQP